MIKNKKIALKIFSISFILFAFYFAYYLLLQDNFASISSIVDTAYTFVLRKHFIVFGLLPVYIAIIIFGIGMLSMYVSSVIENRLKHFFFPNKRLLNKKP